MIISSILSLALAVFFIATIHESTIWVGFYSLFLLYALISGALLIKRHPLGRTFAIWTPWISLGAGMPLFHRGLYLVSHYASFRHPGLHETMAFFFCIGNALLTLPVSIMLLRPAGRLAYERIKPTDVPRQPLPRLPWPVRISAALYCLPFLLAMATLASEIAARESTGSHGPLIDLFTLGLLPVAAGLARRSWLAKAAAFWLPPAIFLAAVLIGRSTEVFEVGGVTFAGTYETMMAAGFLALSAVVLFPALVLLNLASARRVFHPGSTAVGSGDDMSALPGAEHQASLDGELVEGNGG